MDNFLTWETLLTFAGLTASVYKVVEFTKEMKVIKKIKTKYWSYCVALFLLIMTNIATGSFQFNNLLLYILNAIEISLGSNGLSNFNRKNKEE